jgi:hypothetical protein
VDYFVKNAQHTAGKCWRDGDKVYVAHGRKRVRKLRLANLKRVEAGLEPWPFLYTITTCPRNLLRTFVLSENFQRTELSFAEKSEYVRYLVEALGKNPEEVTDELGVSVAQIDAYLAFGQLSPKVIEKVVAGEMSATAAVYLADLSHAEQNEELGKLVEKSSAAGRKKIASVREIRNAVAGTGGKVKSTERIAPTVRELKVLAASDQWADVPRAAQEAILWVIGDSERPAWASSVDPGAIPAPKQKKNGKGAEKLFADAPASEMPS